MTTKTPSVSHLKPVKKPDHRKQMQKALDEFKEDVEKDIYRGFLLVGFKKNGNLESIIASDLPELYLAGALQRVAMDLMLEFGE